MVLRFNDCRKSAFADDVLQDLVRDMAEAKTVDKWIEAIAAGNSRYRPFTCSVLIDGRDYAVLDWGSPGADLGECVSKLRRFGLNRRRTVDDGIEIVADSVEEELLIRL